VIIDTIEASTHAENLYLIFLIKKSNFDLMSALFGFDYEYGKKGPTSSLKIHF
jgi:hypothetical protein